MTLDNEKCSCQKPYNGPRDGLLKQLEAIRKDCPAIKLVFLPDDVWPDYQDWHRLRDHAFPSILLPALQKDCLGRVTSPIHRFFITDERIRSVEKLYRQDLRERWWQYSDPLKQHRKKRAFLGRLAELQFAERLEQQGWSIDNLEAWDRGAKLDIEASAPDGISTSFEVKYLGTEDGVFRTLQEAIEDPRGIAIGQRFFQASINYLVFRTYEAAHQLKSSGSHRIAVIIISDWQGFDQQLADDWIDWNEPCFCKADKIWEDFCIKQLNKYPDLTDDMPEKINTLHEVWILEWTSDFEFVLKYKKKIKTS